MSRVDDSSDEQRIREMQEAELRQRTDRVKRSEEERVTKSFQEVMAQRAAKQTSQQALAKEAQKGASEQAERERGREAPPGTKKGQPLVTPEGMLRRAALKQSIESNLLAQARGKMAADVLGAETDRGTDLLGRIDRDKARLDRDREDRDDKEVRGETQRQEEHRPVGSFLVDPDEERRRGDKGRDRDEGDQGRDRGEQRVDGMAAKGTSQGGQAGRIPQEILDAIAKQIQVAVVADGRTELAIALKGPLLEGVILHVSARKGKVRCTFEGCDKQVANLIESSKGELMRQLGKRGLELDILRTK